MKILIAGAGIGGMALAALLRQRGITTEVFERAPDFNHSGYMISLYPTGSRIFHGLGLMDEFRRISTRMGSYTVCNGHGETVHSYNMGEMLDQYGYPGTLMRGELLGLLRTRCADVPIHFNTKVESFEEREHEVVVRLSDGTKKRGDLVVGADGIHSTLRRQLFGDQPDHDTGWGCWVWTAKNSSRPKSAITEYWGTSRLVGVYPVQHGFGVIGAGPTKLIGPDAMGSDGRRLKGYLSTFGPAIDDLLTELPENLAELFWWKLSDFRSDRWSKGRAVLMGDSACAFLPTAGVGASMALESAAVLADELSRTDAKFIPGALDHYEKRRKKRAEAFQTDSRKMASLMATEFLPMAWGRDQLMKFYTLDMLAKNIFKSLSDPI